MFGRAKQEASPVPSSLAILERPIPVPVTSDLPDENELKAYARTAEAIGFAPASLLEARLLTFFREQGMKRFEYAAVARYLTSQAKKGDQVWFWRPLREKDRPQGWQWGESWDNGMYLNDWYSPNKWVCRPYHRAVPLRVLARVEQIAEAFPSAFFFVTDMADKRELDLSRRPDPFICVTALDVSRIIFDVWDEPGFSG